MASKSSSLRRGPRLSADPHHIAKRKRLIAEEFARDGTHRSIRKTISWGDIGNHAADSPNKRPRTSLSQSITPGLSDMSTPTPMGRPRSALKPSISQKLPIVSSQHRPSSQSKRESTGKPAPILQQSQPQITLQAPSRGGSPQRSQTQREIINLISEETPRSEGPHARNNGIPNERTLDSSSRTEQATKAGQSMGPAATGSSISEAGVQYQEQDVVNNDRLQSPNRVASPASTTPNLPSNLPGNGWDSETTGKHLSSRRDTQPQRNRITSNTGIQTIPDKDVDWLGDLGVEDSMSAIDISRIWAEQRSGPKPSQEPDRSREPGSEPHEPLTGNFLDEAEDPSVDRDEVSKDLSTVEPAEAIANLNEFGREEEQGRDFDPDISGRAPALPTSPVGSFSPSQVVEPSITNPVSSSPRLSSPPPREAISDDPHSSIKPYPFNLQTHKLASTSVHPNTDASVSQVDAQHRPISLSQPNPFVAGARSRSRLYTPQPAPPPRHIHSNELRTAPTLGRNVLEAARPSTSARNDESNKREIVSKDLDLKTKTLKAAPTLGRSTDWGHAGPSRLATVDSSKKAGPSTDQQPTDYDVEYGSIPEAPSSLPLRPPSLTHEWELEPLHASTPHKLVTRMSPLAHDLVRESTLTKTGTQAENASPTTLVDLDKRRRSFVAPLAQSKKIRREYDTIESNVVPQLRAHRDTYDESGRRSWVPKRPAMKRALDVPSSSMRKSVGSGYPAAFEEELEPTDERHDRVLPESAIESRPETFEPVSYGEIMQEHQVESGEQPWQTYPHEIEDRAPHPSTEISETPQSTRVRDPYDLTTSEVQSHRFESEQPPPPAPPKPTDFAYALSQEQPTPSAVREHDHSVNSTRNEPTPSPTAERVAPGSQIISPQHIRLDQKSTKKATSSKPKRPSSGLQITPARQSVWSPPRTRLSMGGRSGISLIEVSKSDQDILVQAGLRPILKRLSQTHGFTVDVVAEVYQETGSLKDTEDTLERMKHSAEKTRVSISRRRSTLGILSGEQREPAGRSPEASQTNNDYLNWDTSRMGSRILFGASP